MHVKFCQKSSTKPKNRMKNLDHQNPEKLKKICEEKKKKQCKSVGKRNQQT